jgi:threonine/homoserine/homoserine lactone efflux protein
MPLDIFLAMGVFAFVMAFTPGPNNILLTASGVNFGFARTIPHMLGVEVGFIILVLACGAGLGLVFAAFPSLQTALKIAGAAYMLWLAWKVANAHAGDDGAQRRARPFSFLEAAAFQWINPKAVLAAASGIAIYVRPTHAWFDFPVMLALFAVATILSVATWAGFGAALRGLLRDPARARIFNVVMALLLVASIVPMVWAS